MTDGLAKLKIYFMAVFDLQLFFVAMLDGLEHWVKILALVGGLVVTVFTVRKMIQDYKVHQVELEIKREELKQLKQQTKNHHGQVQNKNRRSDS